MAYSSTDAYSYGFATKQTYPALKAEMDNIRRGLTEAENQDIVETVADISGKKAKEDGWKSGFFKGILASIAVNIGGNPEMGTQIGLIIADEKKKVDPNSWTTKIYYGFMAALEYIGLTDSPANDSHSKNASGFMDYLQKRGAELAVADLQSGIERRMTALETKYNPTLVSSPEYINIKKQTLAAVQTQGLALAFGEKTSTSTTLASDQGAEQLHGNDGLDRLESPGPTPGTKNLAFARSTVSGIAQ